MIFGFTGLEGVAGLYGRIDKEYDVWILTNLESDVMLSENAYAWMYLKLSKS